jgi:ATP/maltotriose-dependent transcriptional regulator MalT
MRHLLIDFRSTSMQQASGTASSGFARLFTYAGKILAAFPKTPSPLLEPLSERELGILKLISAGLTNEEIAVALVIAPSTVKTHINNLYGKLGTHRRTEAVAIAREKGLFSD